MSAGSHLDDEVLSAFVDGELADVEARSVLAHQAVCESCRARVEAFRRVASLVAAAPRAVSGAGLEPGEDPAARIVAALLAGADPGTRRVGRRGWQAVASVAAALAGVAIVLGVFGHSAAPTGSSTGLATSLGSFSSSRELSATLATEIASLAPNPSAQVLPCQAKAAASAAQPTGTRPAFSSPLVYSGVKAEVFAYEPAHRQGKGGPAAAGPGSGSRPAPAHRAATGSTARSTATGHPGKVAVVVRDRDCSLVAYLSW